MAALQLTEIPSGKDNQPAEGKMEDEGERSKAEAPMEMYTDQAEDLERTFLVDAGPSPR